MKSSGDVRFYIEVPDPAEGPNGCIRFVPAVIEARLARGGSPEAGGLFGDPQRQVLLFLAPPEVAEHIGRYLDVPGAFAEVEGPARLLSPQEYEEIWSRVTAAASAR